MLLDESFDDDGWVELESSFNEVAQQFRQENLRNFEEEVDVLGESGTAADRESEPADERVADRSGAKRIGQRRDGSHGFARQKLGVNVHGVR